LKEGIGCFERRKHPANRLSMRVQQGDRSRILDLRTKNNNNNSILSTYIETAFFFFVVVFFKFQKRKKPNPKRPKNETYPCSMRIFMRIVNQKTKNSKIT